MQSLVHIDLEKRGAKSDETLKSREERRQTWRVQGSKIPFSIPGYVVHEHINTFGRIFAYLTHFITVFDATNVLPEVNEIIVVPQEVAMKIHMRYVMYKVLLKDAWRTL